MKTVFLKAGLILSLSILFSGCVKEEAPDGTGNQGQEVDILAEAPVWGVEGTAIQGLETKTIRAEDGSTYWSPGNPITVFQGTYARSDFYANIPEPATTAVFRGTIDVITGTNENSDGPIDFWAVYPASENNDFDGTGVTLVVKDDMTGTAGTFTNDDFPSIGTSPGLAIAFYNVCSGLALQVSEPGIMSVTVKGNNNENLAGKVYVKFADKRPQVDKVIEGKGSVLFNAPGDYGFQVGETYFIPILPVTFENGFEISYTKHVVTDTGDIDIMTGSYRYDETVTLERSVFGRAYNLDAEIEFVKSGEISGDPSSALMDV